MEVKSVDIITRAARPDQFSAAPDRDQKRRRLWLHTLFFQPKQHAPLLGPACFLLDSSSLHLLLHLRRCSSPGMLRSLPPLLSYLLFCPSSSLRLHNDAFLPKLWSATRHSRFLDGSFSFIFAHSSSGPSRPIAIAQTLLLPFAFCLLSPSSPLTQSPFQQVPWFLGESGCFPSLAPFT